MGCYVLLRDCFILLLPCHLGALLWPLQLRQQAVYANHSPSVLRHIARSLSVGWFSLLPRPRGISLDSRDLFRPILLYCVILCCVRGYRRLVPCRLFWLWTGRRAGLLVKPPPVPLSALELLSSTITSNAPGFAKPHQCRCISEILCVVARSATLAVSRLFRDLVTTSATTVSRDVTSCCATVSSCCCPATWGPTWLWPLQLRQQAVYACTVYKDPRYAKPHSSVLTTHC